MTGCSGERPEGRRCSSSVSHPEVKKHPHIVEIAEFCLVYDRPLADNGLTWWELIAWWMSKHDQTAESELDAGRQLYDRLRSSMNSNGRPGFGPRLRLDHAGRPACAQIIDSSHGSSDVVAIADFGPDLDEPASAARSIA